LLVRTDTITNEVLEPIMFILQYPTILRCHDLRDDFICFGITHV